MSILTLSRRLYQRLRSDFEREAKRQGVGLTLTQFEALRAISYLTVGEGAAPTQSAVVEASGVDRSTLADLLRRMQEARLVVASRSDADLRANIVQLTAAGGAALTKGEAALAAVEARILRSVDGAGTFSEALEAAGTGRAA